jgi:mono/diheme cytochrome c family protein
MSRPVKSSIALGIVLPLIAGCTDFGRQANEMPTRSDGAAFYASNCAACHGPNGKGNGPEALGIGAIPPDLTVLSRDNGGTFPQAQALAYIWGDPEKSHIARVMPEFSGEMAEDLVPVKIDGILTPTPRELVGLLFYLESIQQ